MENRKCLFADRRFLNKDCHHSIAAVSGSVKEETDNENWAPIEAEFHISNCDRSISLDLYIDDLDSLENTIYKMEQIEKVSKGMKEALLNSKDILVKWLENQKKKREDSTTSNN